MCLYILEARELGARRSSYVSAPIIRVGFDHFFLSRTVSPLGAAHFFEPNNELKVLVVPSILFSIIKPRTPSKMHPRIGTELMGVFRIDPVAERRWICLINRLSHIINAFAVFSA